jgi:hypothetical protein
MIAPPLVTVKDDALGGFLRRAIAAKDVVITTRRRWAVRVGTVAPVWHVLESRTVGGKDIVAVGNAATASGDTSATSGARQTSGERPHEAGNVVR